MIKRPTCREAVFTYVERGVTNVTSDFVRAEKPYLPVGGLTNMTSDFVLFGTLDMYAHGFVELIRNIT